MSGQKPGSTQRQLDFYLGLPVGASEDILRQELARRSPGLSDETRKVRLSEMRKFTHPVVRANIATIAAWAARTATPGTERYSHAFGKAATAIRRGRTLR